MQPPLPLPFFFSPKVLEAMEHHNKIENVIVGLPVIDSKTSRKFEVLYCGEEGLKKKQPRDVDNTVRGLTADKTADKTPDPADR